MPGKMYRWNWIGVCSFHVLLFTDTFPFFPAQDSRKLLVPVFICIYYVSGICLGIVVFKSGYEASILPCGDWICDNLWFVSGFSSGVFTVAADIYGYIYSCDRRYGVSVFLCGRKMEEASGSCDDGVCAERTWNQWNLSCKNLFAG